MSTMFLGGRVTHTLCEKCGNEIVWWACGQSDIDT